MFLSIRVSFSTDCNRYLVEISTFIFLKIKKKLSGESESSAYAILSRNILKNVQANGGFQYSGNYPC